jgi:hypothetical protein
MRLSRDANDRLDKLARELEHQSINPNDDVEDTEISVPELIFPLMTAT